MTKMRSVVKCVVQALPFHFSFCLLFPLLFSPFVTPFFSLSTSLSCSLSLTHMFSLSLLVSPPFVVFPLSYLCSPSIIYFLFPDVFTLCYVSALLFLLLSFFHPPSLPPFLSPHFTGLVSLFVFSLCFFPSPSTPTFSVNPSSSSSLPFPLSHSQSLTHTTPSLCLSVSFTSSTFSPPPSPPSLVPLHPRLPERFRAICRYCLESRERDETRRCMGVPPTRLYPSSDDGYYYCCCCYYSTYASIIGSMFLYCTHLRIIVVSICDFQ